MNELSLFDTLFGNDGFAVPSAYTTPAYMPKVDVLEKNDAYILTMDLPGRTENDVELSLKEGVLTIASVKPAETKEKNEQEEETKWLLRERKLAQFRRTFQLPADVNEENVSASFKNGVLNITMGRKPAPVEKKIAINAA